MDGLCQKRSRGRRAAASARGARGGWPTRRFESGDGLFQTEAFLGFLETRIALGRRENGRVERFQILVGISSLDDALAEVHGFERLPRGLEHFVDRGLQKPLRRLLSPPPPGWRGLSCSRT